MDGGYDLVWLIAAAGFFALFLLWLMRRRIARRETDVEDDEVSPGPDDFTKARIQFFMALALLVVIVVVAVLTHLQ